VSFLELGLGPPLTGRLAGLGFHEPTPIQRAAIPAQIAGHDVLGIAATGSGKTSAFGLPLLQRLTDAPGQPAPGTCRALVLAPTRELAVQIMTSLRAHAGGDGLRAVLVVGGTPRGRQIEGLGRGADLVVATPGRLIDLMRARALRLGATRHLVLDEADRMLDMGFLEPVRRIAADLTPGCQTVMFTATMPAPVAALAQQLLRRPVRVEVPAAPAGSGLVAARAELVAPREKRSRLLALLEDAEVVSAIVFCRTRKGADRLGEAIARAGRPVEVIHGERRQEERTRALDAFRRGEVALLVATDLVARGIDVPGVSHVINFDLPDDAESYVHRVGRTGRNGATGSAITLCVPADLPRLRALERAIGGALLPRICRACLDALAGGGRRAPCPGCPPAAERGGSQAP
jgi:ATP-dependent RNA helicase RhlE